MKGRKSRLVLKAESQPEVQREGQHEGDEMPFFVRVWLEYGQSREKMHDDKT